MPLDYLSTIYKCLSSLSPSHYNWYIHKCHQRLTNFYLKLFWAPWLIKNTSKSIFHVFSSKYKIMWERKKQLLVKWGPLTCLFVLLAFALEPFRHSERNQSKLNLLKAKADLLLEKKLVKAFFVFILRQQFRISVLHNYGHLTLLTLIFKGVPALIRIVVRPWRK